jgi:choline dehydrogenase-like flavoprotein
LQDEALIIGGGVAGCAASIELARKGRSVTLIEREPTPRHKVCGGFLSGDSLEDLHALGIDVTSLGAVPIDYVRLAAARRARRPLCHFQQSRSRAMRSIQRLSPRPSPPESALSIVAVCSRSAARLPTSVRLSSTTEPPTKLQPSFSLRANTICAATIARWTLTKHL